jgi:acyl-CoA synthetase (AMP-forming)/AMP-acid ligase II
MINRGGSKSAPEMIEEVLRQVPEIGDAAVFGGLQRPVKAK